jgi:hypothetical protein
LFLSFSFCTKEKSPYPRIINLQERKIVLANVNNMIQFIDYSSMAWNIDEDFDVKNKDLFKINNNLVKRINLDTLLPKYNIKVIVDTTYTISASGFFYKHISQPKNIIIDGLINGKEATKKQLDDAEKQYMIYLDKKFKYREDYLECFPLLILNKSKDTILTRFKFIQEAKDINGNWKPIECYYNFGGCGNPESYYHKLVSNKYIIFPVIKYYGNLKTKIRVKLYNKGNVYYSNEFSGYINQTQFDQNIFRKEFERVNPQYDFNEYSNFFFLDK